MKDSEAARHVAEICLAEDRPLAEGLAGWAPNAAAAAARGSLKTALTELGFDARLAALGVARSAALRRARARIDELPSPASLRAPLVQTGLWFALIAFIQLVVLTILESKVFPVLGRIVDDHQLSAPPWAELASTVLGLGTLVVAAVGLAGLVAPKWLPGWGRTRWKAREAAIAAALAETAPPEDTWSAWLRGAPVLQQLPTATTAADFRALALEWGRRSEQQLSRFVTFYRYFGFAVLTLVALATAAYVYSVCALLTRAT